MDQNQKPIGIFDSGVGGISVLRTLKKAMPHENFIYYSDAKNAPYGTRTREEVVALTCAAVDFLLSQDVKAVVIACNTATTASLATLKKTCPVPVVGIEPAVEWGCSLCGEGKLLVMATPRTMDSPRLLEIMAPYREKCIPMPCPGLMEFVERGELDSPALHAYLEKLLAPVQHENITVAALGCTHYPFVADAVQKHLSGKVQMIDGSQKTLEQLLSALEREGNLACRTETGTVEMHTSGNDACIMQMEKLLNM